MTVIQHIQIVCKIVNFLGVAPFQMRPYKNYTSFEIKTISTAKDKVKTFIITLLGISGIMIYVLGTHRSPIIQENKQSDVKNSVTNKILLYITGCSSYIIVLLTYFYQFIITQKVTNSMKLLLSIESKLEQYGASIKFIDKKKTYAVLVLIFTIDIGLKIYDTFYLAYENVIPLHGIYEHIVRYSFIIIMDLIILQWGLYIHFLELHFNAMIKIVKQVETKQCWFISDFTTLKKWNQKGRHMLKDIGIMYDNLYSVVKQLNIAYGLSILLIIPTSFIITTVTIFSLCKIVKKGNGINPFMTLAYLDHTLYILRMIGIILPPLRVTRAAKKFIAKFHSLDLQQSDNETVSTC